MYSRKYILGFMKVAAAMVKSGAHHAHDGRSNRIFTRTAIRRKSAQKRIKKEIEEAISSGYRDKMLQDEANSMATKDMKPDPSYYTILVGGANAAGRGPFGISAIPFGALANGDKENRVLFRHNQTAAIRAAIRRALKSGKRVRVAGHSWGGATVARLAGSFPDAEFYAMDPTSWTGRIRSIPKNLTIYRPSVEGWSDRDTVLSNLAPILGGRWPKIEKGEGKIVEYDGGHVSGVDTASSKIALPKTHEGVVDNSSKDAGNNLAGPYASSLTTPWQVGASRGYIGQGNTARN